MGRYFWMAEGLGLGLEVGGHKNDVPEQSASILGR